MTPNKVFRIRAYKLSELAKVYRVSKRTMKKWIEPFAKEIGKPVGHFYLGPQVKLINKYIGSPYGEVAEEN